MKISKTNFKMAYQKALKILTYIDSISEADSVAKIKAAIKAAICNSVYIPEVYEKCREVLHRNGQFSGRYYCSRGNNQVQVYDSHILDNMGGGKKIIMITP